MTHITARILYNIGVNTAIADKLNAFFTSYKHQLYKKGELLIRADEDPSGIFLLKSGNVKEYAISRSGNEIAINIFKPISFFPMSWAINNTPNSYFFEAITPVEVWKAPKEEVLTFIKQNNDVLYDLLSRVYKGTDGILARLTYLMSGNAYTKLLIELLIHVKRFGSSENNISYKIKVTETDLATHAGIARETVSREMKTLKEKGLVEFKNNILYIPDITRLQAELSTSF